jgi:arylamine N-acetyltransferase
VLCSDYILPKRDVFCAFFNIFIKVNLCISRGKINFYTPKVELVNNKFGIRYSNGETFVKTLSSPEEIRAVFSEEFMLPKLPVTEAIEVLKTLEIDIFAQSTK